MTTASETLDAATTTAAVAQDGADAASGVTYTDAIEAAWEQQQLADAAAAQQWNTAAANADQTALNAAEQDGEACDNAEVSAWQSEVTTILTAEGSAVDAWAQQAGTNYAHLEDAEASAWISGTESDVTADVTDAEAYYNDQTNAAVADAEASDAEADAEDSAAQTAVHTEADAAVADANDQAQAVVAETNSEDTAWQTDEQTAETDSTAHDTDEAAAAVTDANAGQAAADAWEQAEAPAADADQQAVASANDTSAHAEDAADDTGNDAIAAAAKTQENHDAAAAQTHDTNVAAAVHQDIIQDYAAKDAAVQAGAAQALADVNAAVQNLPADVTAAANAQVADAHAKNVDFAAKSISLTTAARTVLTNQVQTQVNAGVTAAQQQRNTDAVRPATDVEIQGVNPPQPQSWIQTLADFMPNWTTIVAVGLFTAGLVIPGAQGLLFVGLSVWALSAATSAADRYMYRNQTVAEALQGGIGDVTGIGAFYMGLYGRDFGTGNHLGLTQAQQRQTMTDGTLQSAMSVIAAGALIRGGLRPFSRGGAPASQTVTTGVGQLRAAIPAAQQGRITMALAVVEDSNGARSLLVSSSEGAYMRGPVRPVVESLGAQVVGGTGHAEANIVAHAQANNLRLIDIGATRPVCVPCQDVINPTGANISTPLLPRPTN